jgi:hypothetical protein
MLAIPGHTIFLATREQWPAWRITLECTCGRVLHAANFAVNDVNHRQIVRDEGHALAVEHLQKENVKRD